MKDKETEVQKPENMTTEDNNQTVNNQTSENQIAEKSAENLAAVEIQQSAAENQTQSETTESTAQSEEIIGANNSKAQEAQLIQIDNNGGAKERGKGKLALKIAQICGFALLCVIFILLTVNSMLCVFLDHYYPTFGEYRLFAIVSDSMEGDAQDAIPTGSMIVGRVPKSQEEIQVGTVITYELEQGNSIILITHRVIEIRENSDTGEISYVTRGDNAPAADSVRPVFDDVVGVYTGNRCGFFGYFFGFLQAPEGAITLIIILLIIIMTALIVHFVNLINVWREVALNALKKSGSFLKAIDNIEELGTISDVIGIVSKDPEGKADIKRKDEKLNWYIQMSALPKRPYPNDLAEYLKTLGDNVKPVPVPKLRYAYEDDVEENSEIIDYRVEEFEKQPIEENTEEPESVGELLSEPDGQLPEQPVEEPEPVEQVEEPAEVQSEEPENVEPQAQEEQAVTEVEEQTEQPVEEPEPVEQVEEPAEMQSEEPENVESQAQEEQAVTEVEEQAEQPAHPVEITVQMTEEGHVLTVEEILKEAEETSDEEPDLEILPEEDEPQEEVRSVDNITGLAVIVRYKKSFTAKYIQSDDKTKSYYSMLKNALLSYRKVKSRISWNHENFNSGRNNIARFSIRGKSLCIYFALDPDDYLGTKYKIERADSKKYVNIPCMYRIKNARRAKYALDLIDAVAAKFALERGETKKVNYYLPYEQIQPLIERELVKELVSEESYKEFMLKHSRKEVDSKRRQFISAKEVNSVIDDEVAIALVEDKRETQISVKAKTGGKKAVVNVDVLSDNFEADEVVNIESLKAKGLVPKNAGTVKILARGVLTKPLTVEAQDFSIEAIKMIVLTGGKVTKI